MSSPAKAPAKTNFKTYEASTRLLAAVIATNKGLKLDFKELAALVGNGVTGSALEHRMRPVKQLAKMQLASRAKGEDPGQLPVEKGEIQKLFGESTPGGIEFQFRDIKALGRAQADAVANGDNPAQVSVAGGKQGKGGAKSAASTPASRASKATTATATPGTGTSTAAKRKRNPTIRARNATDSDVDDDDAGDTDYSLKDMDADETPTRTQKRRVAGAAANATPRSTTAAKTASASTTKTANTTATPGSKRKGNGAGDIDAGGARRSLFGNGAPLASGAPLGTPIPGSRRAPLSFDDVPVSGGKLGTASTPDEVIDLVEEDSEPTTLSRPAPPAMPPADPFGGHETMEGGGYFYQEDLFADGEV